MTKQRCCDWRSLSGTRQAMCPALAVDGTDYCAAHLKLIRGFERPAKPDRTENKDADLLPLTDEEFRALSELRERTR